MDEVLLIAIVVDSEEDYRSKEGDRDTRASYITKERHIASWMMTWANHLSRLF